MKVRTIPQEYEAIVFNGVTSDVKEFIAESHCGIHEQENGFVLSSIIGNQGLSVGDILYKVELSMLSMLSISVIKKDSDFSKYFEVVE